MEGFSLRSFANGVALDQVGTKMDKEKKECQWIGLREMSEISTGHFRMGKSECFPVKIFPCTNQLRMRIMGYELGL